MITVEKQEETPLAEALAYKRAAEIVMSKRHFIRKEVYGLLFFLNAENQYRYMLDLFNVATRDQIYVFVEETALKGHVME